MKIILYFLVGLAFLSFATSIVVTYLNSRKIPAGLFFNTRQDVDFKYHELISPDQIVISVIWPIIYLWNAVGILYIVVAVFLPIRMSPVKADPTLTTPVFLLGFSGTFLMHVGWIFSYDAEALKLSLSFVLMSVTCAYITLWNSCKRIYSNLSILKIKGNVMLWMMRIGVQNGFCVLTTWLTVVVSINMADVIIFRDSYGSHVAILRGDNGSPAVTREVGSMIGLGVLFVVIIAWFVIENFVWEKYCRFVFTVYPVLILYFSGLLVKLMKRRDTENVAVRSAIALTSVELAVSCIAFVVRISLTIYKIKAGSAATA